MTKRAGKWFVGAKGVGFVEPENGKDGLVHYSAFLTEGLQSVEQGSRVSFELRDGPKGPAAENVPSTQPTPRSRRLLTGIIALTLSLIQTNASFGVEGQWAEGTPMPTARFAHESEVVDGKIYAIGGVLANRTETGVNEVYDPTTDSWSNRAPMPTARGGAASAVVNGRIYMIGGAVGFEEPNWLAGIQTLSTVEEYDPDSDSWATRTPMPTRRTDPGIFVVNDKIHVIAGWRGPVHDDFPNVIEVYDPVTDTWEELRRARYTARGFFAMSWGANGKIYQFGGTRSGVVGGRETTEIDPLPYIWTAKALMPSQRHFLSASTLHGKIYAMGGSDVNAPALAAVQVYDPHANTWEFGLDMPRARGSFETVTLDGKIYAFGGLSGIPWGDRGTIYASMDVYTPNPIIGTITPTPSGTIEITIPEGATYDIEYSADLTPDSWIVSQRGVSGSYQDTDPIRTGRRHGFYRSVFP